MLLISWIMLLEAGAAGRASEGAEKLACGVRSPLICIHYYYY